MTQFEFMDEPPPSKVWTPRSASQTLLAFAAALRENPGRWAMYPNKITRVSAYRTSSNINTGKGSLAFKVGEFEALTRDGQVYVRYIGTEPEKE